MKKKNKRSAGSGEHAKSFAAAQVASATASNYAEATDKMVEGMDVFRRVVAETGSNPMRHGNLFECIEAAKFNADAALKGLDLNAQVTASPSDPTFLKDPHSPADVVIRNGGQVVREVQAKAYRDPSSAAFAVKDGKYSGMDRLVPEDKAPRVSELLDNRAESASINAGDYQDASENLKSELSHGDVSSSGTTYDESISAKDHPHIYSTVMEAKQLGKEVGASAGHAAVAGLLIGGGVSAIKNTLAVRNGKKDIESAIADSTKDGVRVGVKSAAIGGTGAVIRFGANKAGLETLAKSNIATAVAAGVINTGVTIYALAKGEIDTEIAMERMGQAGVSTVYGMFAGSVAGVVFAGPAAAMVGTIAGYLLANSAYQSCIAILKEARFAEDRAKIIRSICDEAVKEMEKQRNSFELQVDEQLNVKRGEISKRFAEIDQSMKGDDTGAALIALSDFALMFGKHLRFQSFDDFDEHMQDSNRVLNL